MTTRHIIGSETGEAGNRLLRLLGDTHQYIVADIETTGLRPYHGDKIIGLALYFPTVDESYYIVVRHPENNVPESYWRGVLFALPRSADTLIGFNFKFDLHFLGLEGMADPAAIEEVMIAAHLLNENEYLSNDFQTKGAYQLKRLAPKYLGRDAVNDENNLKAWAKEHKLDAKKDMWLMPAEIVAPYAMADVEITWRLRNYYMPGLERWRQVDLYRQRNAFVLKALLRMERNGIRVNTDTIAQHQAEIAPRIAELQAEFDYRLDQMDLKLTGKKDERRINLNSPMQLKTFFSLNGNDLDATDKLVLKGLAGRGNQWAKMLLEYRTLAKANGTYYEPYLNHVDPNGFVHTTLNPIGTTSGRLSSYDPNFQQIPRGSDSFKVKEVFEPRPGYASFGTDYSQLELRLGVHYSGEETMRRMFNEGTDLHQFTADKLGVTRHQGKTANFGLLYGLGAKRAAPMFGVDEEEAQRIVYGWRDLYSAFPTALQTWERLAREWRDPDGNPGGKFQYVRLFNGRTRKYQEFLRYPRSEKRVREDGYEEIVEIPPPYRDAFNFYIQGTGAAIAEASILRVVEAFPDNDVLKPVLSVHDAIETEIAIEHVHEVVPEMERLMTDWPQFDPPMAVVSEFSLTNWNVMEKYTPEKFDQVIKEVQAA